MGQAEAVGTQGGQQGGLAGIAEGEGGVAGHHPAAPGKREGRRKPAQPPKQQNVRSAAAQSVAGHGHKQAAGGAAQAAHGNAEVGGPLAQAPLLAQADDHRAEQQHSRCGQRHRGRAQPVIPGAQHPGGRKIQGRALVWAALAAGQRRFGGRVLQKEASGGAHGKAQPGQPPKAGPNARLPAHPPYKQREEGPGSPHCPTDEPGGQALFISVPLLGAAHHGRVEKGRAQSNRQAEPQAEQPSRPAGHKARRRHAEGKQGGAPKPGGAGAFCVLQVAAENTAHPEPGDGQAEHGAHVGPAQVVFGHDRAAEYAPGGRNAGENLDGGPGCQNQPPV